MSKGARVAVVLTTDDSGRGLASETRNSSFPPPPSTPLYFTRPLQRMHTVVNGKVACQLVKNHERGVYHGNLGVDSVLIGNDAHKTTFGPDDIHLVGYERAGTVSDRFRDEVGYHTTWELSLIHI